MSFLHFIYTFITSCLAVMVLPVVWCLERRDHERKKALAERLGGGSRPASITNRKEPVLWMQIVGGLILFVGLYVMRRTRKPIAQSESSGPQVNSEKPPSGKL